jgi:hypothetical protein
LVPPVLRQPLAAGAFLLCASLRPAAAQVTTLHAAAKGLHEVEHFSGVLPARGRFDLLAAFRFMSFRSSYSSFAQGAPAFHPASFVQVLGHLEMVFQVGQHLCSPVLQRIFW